MNQRLAIFLLFLFLAACAPTSYVYVKKASTQQHEIKNVLVMVEYLDVKDDIKGLWNFEETTNIANQDILFNIASQMLTSKGYKLSDKNLKTSGLIIDRNFLVDHYVEKNIQNGAISPPYILRSVNLEDADIQNLESLLAELNRPISPVMADYRSFVKNNFIQQTTNLNLQEDSAILVIQAYKPRVSFFADFDVGYSVSSSNSGGFVGVSNAKPRPTSYAYLIHVGTGDVLWSNKTTLINTNNHEKFFLALPINKYP